MPAWKMKALKWIKGFFAVPAREKQLFLEAVFFMYYVKILLIFLPVKSCFRFFENQPADPIARDALLLDQIKKSGRRANHLAFWKNVCLVQSMALRWMLQRRNIQSTLYLGATIGQQRKFIAHAWLKADDYEVVEKAGNYVELYSI